MRRSSIVFASVHARAVDHLLPMQASATRVGEFTAPCSQDLFAFVGGKGTSRKACGLVLVVEG